MVISEKTYTVDEFWDLSQLPENSEKRLELVQGRVVEMSPSSTKHGMYAARVFTLISIYVMQHKLGYMTSSESGYLLDIGDEKPTIRAPDVGFFRRERFDEVPDEGFARFAPDLAVEIVSPNDRAADIHHKISDYLQAGVAQVWIVYPEGKKIDVHTLSGIERLTETDTLRGGDVLPGFEVTVTEIFDLSL